MRAPNLFREDTSFANASQSLVKTDHIIANARKTGFESNSVEDQMRANPIEAAPKRKPKFLYFSLVLL